MNNLKNYYNYELVKNILNSNEKIKNIFDKNKDNNKNFNLKELKEIYEIIKKIPNNILEEINSKIKDNDFKNKINFAPDFIQVKNNEIPDLSVIDNFEILNREIVKIIKKENNNIKEIVY